MQRYSSKKRGSKLHYNVLFKKKSIKKIQNSGMLERSDLIVTGQK